MKNLQKIITWILILALVVLSGSVFVGCTPNDGEDGDDDGDGNDDGGSTDGGAQLVLVDGGEVKFKVVKTSDLKSKGNKAASDLVKQLRDLDLDVSDVVDDGDASAVSDCEIIIGTGAKNRGDDCNISKRAVGDEGYQILVVGNRLIVAVYSDDMVEEAMSKVTREIFGIRSKTETLEGETISIERTYSRVERTSYTFEDIEFGGESLKSFYIDYDTQNTTLALVASEFREGIYEWSGIWMPLKADVEDGDTTYTKKLEIKVSDSAGGNFKITPNADGAVMEAKLIDRYTVGVKAFINTYVAKSKNEVVKLNNAYTYAIDALRYSEYGAVGDGKNDDAAAVLKTHQIANQLGYSVMADPGATYYFGDGSRGFTIPIKTDTDWGDARFIIDDSIIKPYEKKNGLHFDRLFYMFEIRPDVDADMEGYYVDQSKLAGLTLGPNSTNVGLTFETDSMIYIENSNNSVYIRYGQNATSGIPQRELLIVDKNGNLDEDTPIVWEYDVVTSVLVYPIDADPITVKGGTFTTKANVTCTNFPSDAIDENGKKMLPGDQYYYYNRGIDVRRSNVTLDGITHYITGEQNSSFLNGGYPYGGFYTVEECNNTLIQNCVMSGHRMYQEDRDGVFDATGNVITPPDGNIDSTEINTGTHMGTYDILVGHANKITWRNCTQANDFTSAEYWGVMNSNFGKNLTWENCKLSRFDAHEGVYNATIKDSEIGHSLSVVGAGTLHVENVKKYSYDSFMTMRADYGSTWQGDIIIKDCTLLGWQTEAGYKADSTNPYRTIHIIGLTWYDHYFGYTCYMPNLTVDNFQAPNATTVYIMDYCHLEQAGRTFVNAVNNPLVPAQYIRVKNMPKNYDLYFGTARSQGVEDYIMQDRIKLYAPAGSFKDIEDQYLDS